MPSTLLAHPTVTASTEASTGPPRPDGLTKAEHWSSSSLPSRLNREWALLCDSAGGRRSVRDWAAPSRNRAALSELVGVDGLHATVQLLQSADVTAIDRDGILVGLLDRAQDGDRLAGRVVLQTMLPAAVRIAQAITSRPDVLGDQDEAFALVVAALWQIVATYPVARRRAKVPANLYLDTLALVRRGHTSSAHRAAALPLFSTPVVTRPSVPGALHAVPPIPDDATAAWQPAATTGAPPSPTALPAAAVWHPTTAGRAASVSMAPVAPVALAAPTGEVDWGQVRAFRQQAAELLTAQLRDRPGLDEATRREIGRALIVSMLNDRVDSLIAQGTPAPTPAAQHALSTAIFDSLFGLGRLQPLVDDPDVENIEIRGYDRVHLVYGDGAVQVGPPVADSDEELIETLAFLASQSGRAFTPLNWELDLRLHGGHRLAARAWRCPRPTVVIRIHRYTDIDLGDLQRLGMVDGVLAHFLGAAVRAGKAIVVSGEQGAGKTTLVRALCSAMDPWESIVPYCRTAARVYMSSVSNSRDWLCDVGGAAPRALASAAAAT